MAIAREMIASISAIPECDDASRAAAVIKLFRDRDETPEMLTDVFALMDSREGQFHDWPQWHWKLRRTRNQHAPALFSAIRKEGHRVQAA